MRRWRAAANATWWRDAASADHVPALPGHDFDKRAIPSHEIGACRIGRGQHEKGHARRIAGRETLVHRVTALHHAKIAKEIKYNAGWGCELSLNSTTPNIRLRACRAASHEECYNEQYPGTHYTPPDDLAECCHDNLVLQLNNELDKCQIAKEFSELRADRSVVAFPIQAPVRR